MASRVYPSGKVLALIINEIHFDAMGEEETFQDRQGAEEDEAALMDTLELYNIEVRTKRNQTAMEIRQFICEVSMELNTKCCPYAGLIVFVMSHGGQDNGQDFIVGKDNNKVYTAEVIDPFDNENCLGMSRKPKCFLLNFCRGEPFNTNIKITALDSGKTFTDPFFDEPPAITDCVIENIEVGY